MQVEVAQAFVGQFLDNRYRLLRVLGAGAFGCVLEAEHRVGDEVLARVAVKILPSKAAGDVDRLAELRHAIELTNECLVRCYHAGDAALAVNGVPVPILYIAMELASGTLHDRLQDGLLGAREARDVAEQVASALEYLRSRNVVHRDVKPSNILRVGDKWKLADLGLVTPLAEGRTADTPTAGTFVYIAPEVHEGQTSSASDIWSLGVTLLEAVTGRLPFEWTTLGDWLYNLKRTAPEIPPGIPEPLETVIRSCLVRDRTRRLTAAGILAVLGSAPRPCDQDRSVVVVATEGGDFTSLTDAVAAAPAGSRIVVHPGTYRGCVSLTKPLDIRGVGATADVVIDGVTDNALVIDTSDALVSGMTFIASAPPRAGFQAVVEIRSGQSLLDLCEISSADSACLYVRGGNARPVIRRCRLHGRRKATVVFDCDAEPLLDASVVRNVDAAAVVVRDKANPVIRRCRLKSANDRGLWVGEKGLGLVENSAVFGGSTGLEISKAAQPVLRGLTIKSAGRGIKASAGARGIVINCSIDAPPGREWDLAKGHQVQRV